VSTCNTKFHRNPFFSSGDTALRWTDEHNLHASTSLIRKNQYVKRVFIFPYFSSYVTEKP